MTPTNSTQPKLYTRYVATLKILQYVGYFLVAAFLALILFSAISAQGSSVFLSPVIIVFVIQAAIAIGFVYIVTQGLIALVDLLSRIEANTRDR